MGKKKKKCCLHLCHFADSFHLIYTTEQFRVKDLAEGQSSGIFEVVGFDLATFQSVIQHKRVTVTVRFFTF